MRRTLAIATTMLLVLACSDSSGPGDRIFPAGTYDLAVPFNGASTWAASVPADFPGAGPGCGEFIGGSITIAANGAASARRVFRQGDATWEQVLEGTSRFQDGVIGFLIDYGPRDEHAHAAPEGSTMALYVSHIFPARGTCPQMTASVRYVRR